MRARMPLPAFAALLALTAVAAPAMAQDGGTPRSTVPDTGGEVYQGVPLHQGAPLWPEHAAADDAVAREGRAAMPFTASQIEALGQLLRETQGAASLAADPATLSGAQCRRRRIKAHRKGRARHA